jgi:hypothetical protein
LARGSVLEHHDRERGADSTTVGKREVTPQTVKVRLVRRRKAVLDAGLSVRD